VNKSIEICNKSKKTFDASMMIPNRHAQPAFWFCATHNANVKPNLVQEPRLIDPIKMNKPGKKWIKRGWESEINQAIFVRE